MADRRRGDPFLGGERLNTCNLSQHIDDVLAGREQQLCPLIHVPVLTMNIGQQYKFDLPFDCSFLAQAEWWIRQDNTLKETSPDLVLGIRINTEDATMLPWSRQNYFPDFFLGPIRRFYATVLVAGVVNPGDAIFYAGRAMGIGTTGGFLMDGR